MFDVTSTKAAYSTADLLAVIFLGIIGGILGSLYNFFVNKVLRIYSIINEYAVTFLYCFYLSRVIITNMIL